MKQIVYVGGSDVRELGQDDLARLEIESEDLVFRKGEPIEFKNEVAKVLLESPLLAGEFAEYDPEAVVEGEPDTSGLLIDPDAPTGTDPSHSGQSIDAGSDTPDAST